MNTAKGIAALSGAWLRTDLSIQDAATQMAAHSKLAAKLDEQLDAVDKIVSQELSTSAKLGPPT